MAISKWIFLGLLLAGSTLFFREAAGTSLSGTLARTGLAGANIGTGIQETLTGVGTGFSKLLNPLFTFADVIGKFQTVLGGGGFDSSNNSGGGITTQTTTAALPSGGGTSTISWSNNTSATVPSLSAAAKSFYAARGVSVT
tara:strand:+ start:53 stop:475 length:423 start_codon:yes stop_codon:yes gene_type:complete